MNAQKKLLNVIVFLCFLSSFSFSQTYLGFTGGYNTSESEFVFGDIPSNYEVESTTYIGNVNASFFTEFNFEKKPHYTFRPNVHLSTKGNFTTIEEVDSNGLRALSYVGTINYIGVGLINKVNVFMDKIDVYFLAGPQFENAYSAKITEIIPRGRVAGDRPSIGGGYLDFETVGLKRFDMNLLTGLGFAKHNPGYKIILELTYDISLFDIAAGPEIARNRKTFGMHMGIAFELNRKKENEM